MVGGAAMREIEADDVDAGRDQPRERIGRAACGSERGDDLGGAGHDGVWGNGQNAPMVCHFSAQRNAAPVQAPV